MTPLNFCIFSQERTLLTKLDKKDAYTKELGKIMTILREETILTGN